MTARAVIRERLFFIGMDESRPLVEVAGFIVGKSATAPVHEAACSGQTRGMRRIATMEDQDRKWRGGVGYE